MAGVGQCLNLKFHQSLSGKANHLTQHIRISALFKHRTKRHHLVGHRGHLGSGMCCGDQTLPENHDDRPFRVRPFGRLRLPAGLTRNGRSYTTPRDTIRCTGGKIILTNFQ